jgi:hypothetical protein
MSGCQAYAPRPLPVTVQWSNDAAVPIGPLTVDEVVRLALANSPNVLRGKQDLAVASAKAYADGLPPDPKLANAVFQQQVELSTLIGVSAIDHQPLQ